MEMPKLGSVIKTMSRFGKTATCNFLYQAHGNTLRTELWYKSEQKKLEKGI
jgi:hypothetical protein